jgi:hypothetical protein
MLINNKLIILYYSYKLFTMISLFIDSSSVLSGLVIKILTTVHAGPLVVKLVEFISPNQGPGIMYPRSREFTCIHIT